MNCITCNERPAFIISRGVCRICYQRWLRSTGRIKPYSKQSEEWRQRRRAGALQQYRERVKDPEKLAHMNKLSRERSSRWRKTEMYAEVNKQRVRKCLYGITPEQYDFFLKHQDNACALCKSTAKSLTIDHDHKTGVVRGLLCHKCNTICGFLDSVDVEWMSRYCKYVSQAPPIEVKRSTPARQVRSRLTDKEVAEIKVWLSDGFGTSALARKYNISACVISTIKSNKSRANVDPSLVFGPYFELKYQIKSCGE